MATKSKELSYINIDDPVLVRKHILLGAVDVINMLENYEGIKKIRNEKRKILLEIKSKLNTVHESCEQLHIFFPEINEREIFHEAKQMEQKVESLKNPKKPEGLKHLERELQELQDKLRNLNI